MAAEWWSLLREKKRCEVGYKQNPTKEREQGLKAAILQICLINAAQVSPLIPGIELNMYVSAFSELQNVL